MNRTLNINRIQSLHKSTHSNKKYTQLCHTLLNTDKADKISLVNDILAAQQLKNKIHTVIAVS